MTDYEMFLHLFNKLGATDSHGLPHGPRAEYDKHMDEPSCKEGDFGSAIDLRTNGLIFDKQGDLIGHWAEYD